MRRVPRPGRRPWSRSPIAGTCGTTWANTPGRRSSRTEAARNPLLKPRPLKALMSLAAAAGQPGRRAPARAGRAAGRVRPRAGPGITHPRAARRRPRPAASRALPAGGRRDPGDGNRGTVSRFAREPDPAALLVKATSRDSKLDPFKHFIGQRWNQGITEAAVLHAELAATQGRTGSVQAVRALRPPVPHRRRPDKNRPRRPARPGRPAHPENTPDHPLAVDPAPATSTPMTRPGSSTSPPAARTWTPWPATSQASPR